jgi:Plectin/S10 domain
METLLLVKKAFTNYNGNTKGNTFYLRYLTNEGIEYLRQYLHLPPEIIPSTLKRTTRSDTARPRAAPRQSDGPKSGEDRQAYRRAPGQGQDKKTDVGAGAADLELVSKHIHISKMYE